MTLAASLKAQKKTLRKALSNVLREISADSIDTQSKAIAGRVLSLVALKQARSIGCYLNMPTGEVNTDALVGSILENRKELFVPKITTTDNRMDLLKVYDQDDLASFPSGKWGIREPDVTWKGSCRQNAFDQECGDLDVILVPGVAFDRSLSRLGHGKGYYDRFITSYISLGRPRPLLIALALREQIFEEQAVPMAEHDWKMDYVVTPDEIIQP